VIADTARAVALPAEIDPEDVFVECSVRAPASHELDNYVVRIHGTVSVTVFDDDDDHSRSEEVEVGTVRASMYKLGQAFNDGLPGWDILDADSQESSEYMVLLGTDNDRSSVRDDIIDEFELSTAVPDILIVDRIVIEEPYRGHDLGLHAMRALLNVFGNSAVLVACTPHPIRDEDEPAPSPTALAAAQRKLRAYWKRAGFKRFERTPIYIRNGEFGAAGGSA
jgi:hypothetical protein